VASACGHSTFTSGVSGISDLSTMPGPGQPLLGEGWPCLSALDMGHGQGTNVEHSCQEDQLVETGENNEEEC
jgi:hypothetical protein